MKNILYFVLFSILIPFTLLKCASLAKSFGGTWYKPELALVQESEILDQKSLELMNKYRSNILTFLFQMKEEALGESGDLVDIDLLRNKLVEVGTDFVKFQNNQYLQVTFDKSTSYNIGQSGGLANTARKRAESDFRSGMPWVIKLFPDNLINDDFSGIILITKHAYRDFTAELSIDSPEIVKFVIPFDIFNDFRELKISLNDLLSNIVIVVNDVRV